MTPQRITRCLALFLSAVTMVSTGGCVGLTVQLANMIGMNMVPAQYAGLKGERVAVVCVSPDSSYGPIDTGEMLAVELEQYLSTNVRRIKFVPRGDVMSWQETHASDVVNYAKLGESLEADKVLVVELASFSCHDNATFYQGKANYRVTVHDVETGEREYDYDDPDKAFPAHGGYHLTDMSEEKFKRAFIGELAKDIGRQFHMNDLPKHFVKEDYIR
ncbi:MAG: hypothetical protein RIC55_31710 [Pirellulaceae bacterium]